MATATARVEQRLRLITQEGDPPLPTNYDWNALAEQAEAGQLHPVKGSTLRGQDAARSGRIALLDATGVDPA